MIEERIEVQTRILENKLKALPDSSEKTLAFLFIAAAEEAWNELKQLFKKIEGSFSLGDDSDTVGEVRRLLESYESNLKGAEMCYKIAPKSDCETGNSQRFEYPIRQDENR